MQLRHQIDAEWTVNEIIRQHPETVSIFNRAGIDACCGGALSLREAAREHGLDVDVLLEELRSTAADR